ELHCELEYSTDLFRANTISHMAGHFQTLLTAIVSSPQTPLYQLPLLDQVERAQLLNQWNNTRVDFSRGPSGEQFIHQRFEMKVAECPDKPAVVYHGGKDQAEVLSYKDLDSRANAIARKLARQGVGPGD